MAEIHIKVVLDTNIIVSGILFGGKPKDILELVYSEKIIAVTSQFLLTELQEVLLKKFKFTKEAILDITGKIKEVYYFVLPNKIIHVLKDNPDNRVLEAAVEGNCSFIITGDRALLKLKTFKKIKIVTPNQFLSSIRN